MSYTEILQKFPALGIRSKARDALLTWGINAKLTSLAVCFTFFAETIQKSGAHQPPLDWLRDQRE
jgi:hypothetical protein